MSRPMRRYMEKFEALDLAIGTYHARKLPRTKYNNRDFIEYLNTYTEDDLEVVWMFENDLD